MAEKKKKIAVIGGGLSGIASVIMLRKEDLDPICFEKTDKFGGTWCYREQSVEGIASIMPTTIINHSKEMGAFSNFPPRKEYNNYMRHSELYQYVTDYVKHNGIEKYVRYNMEVEKVKKADDYSETGRWIVTVRNSLTGKVETDIYDGVMVCTGHINRPKMPHYEGQEKFKGKIMHTHSLKRVHEFTDKRVVVVGMGCSALDAAVECSSVAKQVYLSTRSGAFVINRVGPNGYPIDYVLLRRYITFFLDILPAWLCSWYIEKFYLDPKFDHRLYTIQPKSHLLSKDPILNDHIGSKILSGVVAQKGDIKYFTEEGVLFEGDKKVTEVDVVIMATGYTYKYPVLEDGVLNEDDGMIHLYKLMYPIHLKHATLAIIGFLNPFGPGFPLGELQCRWAASIFAGRNHLPSEAKMMTDVKKRYYDNIKRYSPSEKMSIRVDFVQYADEIATELGVKPNLLKLFFTDFQLFIKLLFGPCLSYQYRLEGPHKWDGARDAIMTSEERLHWPLQKKTNIVKKGFIESLIEYVINLVPSNFYL
ncbi:flavin-containing monooxygenase 5-like isoform X1 [Uloborus diversus]|uniref:flavin-containing monooxygenase 5-like isoform X1 n=1 Tax=Uloborus diversus TaxID=327109 RepID=UPI00240A3C62|nr:flavin-containing monooxygenase 5-like isoform X1 [Uloborus diversus]XP_054706186.1 flavin-containing monooxygenase 5-like isoform X1 [Uloborus diversus]